MGKPSRSRRTTERGRGPLAHAVRSEPIAIDGRPHCDQCGRLMRFRFCTSGSSGWRHVGPPFPPTPFGC